jgi:SAM-dependent methyltransferase
MRAGPIPDRARVLEVGSGAGSLEAQNDTGGLRVALDPLAGRYAAWYPWHRGVANVTAVGEALPFGDRLFDVVLSENVIDHAERPLAIVRELVRVLRPGGVLFFSVNVHHPVYHWASRVYGAAHAVGLRPEIGPFADHTVHLTLPAVRRLLHALPLRIVEEDDGLAGARAAARATPPRHAGDRLKRVFFKNARYSVVAVAATR